MSDTSQGPGWWEASDGKWYGPEQHPDFIGDPEADVGEVVAEADEDDEGVESDGKPSKKKRLRPVASFQKAQYLGGLPATKAGTGNLIFTDDEVGVGVLSPKKGVVAWSAVAGISFDSNTIKKSRAGKAALVGVFALAARNSQAAADITVLLKDGNAAMYQVPGKTGQQVRAKVNALLVKRGIKLLDDALPDSHPVVVAAAPSPPPPPIPSASVADEIAKLAALRDSGALTEEEFAAHKASLLPRS